MIPAASNTSVNRLNSNSSWSLFIDIANTLKAFIGINVMLVAYAFSKAGMVRGVIGLIIIAVITEHCCHLLIEIKSSTYHYLSANSNDVEDNLLPSVPEDNYSGYQTTSTSETDVQEAPTYGEVAFRVGGRRAENIINAALILTQFGYCVGYLIFISQTFHDVLVSGAPVSLFVLVPLPLLSVLALLTSIRSLGPFSVIANGALLCGCGAVVAFIAKHFNWTPANVPITSFPLFFGQMTAALEGIGLVIPLQTSMANQNDFPFVLRIALVLLTGLLMSIGVLGFATYGADTRSIILLNFGQTPVVVVVKAVLIIGILFTYPLQIIPVFEFAESKFLSTQTNDSSQIDSSGSPRIPEQFAPEFRITDEDDDIWISSESRNGEQNGETESGDVVCRNNNGIEERTNVTRYLHEEGHEAGHVARSRSRTDGLDVPNPNYVSDLEDSYDSGLFVRDRRIIAIRLGVVVFTALIAVLAGASFGLFQALVGSAGASVLAYTAPAILHNMAFRDQLTQLTKAKNIAIAMFGVMGAIVGTASSMWEIIQVHRGNSSPA